MRNKKILQIINEVMRPNESITEAELVEMWSVSKWRGNTGGGRVYLW